MPFTIIRQKITELKVDAVVNAANTGLRMGGGVCGAIFKAAGPAQLQAACDKLSPIETGEAVITPGFGLPAKFIIHTAGPVYSRQSPQESEKLLRAAYTASLRLAAENNCNSIVFPLISSGIYGYPKDEAFRVASSAIRDFLADSDMHITLALLDKSAFAAGRDLLGEVESYIGTHYEAPVIKPRKPIDVKRQALFKAEERSALFDAPLSRQAHAPVGVASLDALVDNLDEPFSRMLLRLIDTKGMTDVEVYKRANLDRKLFSKIRTGKGYMPGKRTAIALAIALRLSLKETGSLLERAGYALSPAVKFDVIVEYFIAKGQYDIFAINEVLFQYDQPLLGG
ncbi:MAG: macro domain-containing protein [Christensenellales bacterium]